VGLRGPPIDGEKAEPRRIPVVPDLGEMLAKERGQEPREDDVRADLLVAACEPGYLWPSVVGTGCLQRQRIAVEPQSFALDKIDQTSQTIGVLARILEQDVTGREQVVGLELVVVLGNDTLGPIPDVGGGATVDAGSGQGGAHSVPNRADVSARLDCREERFASVGFPLEAVADTSEPRVGGL
jgi:hypothetical protein